MVGLAAASFRPLLLGALRHGYQGYRLTWDSRHAHKLCNLLGLLRGPTLGYQCERYSHSLQSGTGALRNGESIDMVVGALLHDALPLEEFRPLVDEVFGRPSRVPGVAPTLA